MRRLRDWRGKGRLVSQRVRRYLGVVVLLVAALLAFPTTPAVAAPAEACQPTPKSATSLCLTYDVQVLATGTETPTTDSQAPVDLRTSFTNTSTGYVEDAARARWLTGVSTTLFSKGDRQPILTGSADLPDGLLVAGTSAACEKGVDFSFSGCDAGHGVAWVKVKRLAGTVEMKATFGVQRIYHDKSAAAGHFAALHADVRFCIDTNGGALSCNREQSLSRTVTMDVPPAGGTWSLPFQIPTPTNWGLADANEVQGVGIDSVSLHYRGRSDQLTGGPASGAFTWLKLPMRCGVADASGVATSETAGTVAVPTSITIGHCSQLKQIQSPAKLVFGQEGVVSGVLVDYDTGQPMVGAELQLRACNIAFTTPCNFGSSQAQLSTEGGAWSFTVDPTVTTHYFVRVLPTDGKPDQWIMRRINVAPKVTLATSKTAMRPGRSVTLSGRVKPGHAGDTVNIKRKLSGGWTTVDDVVLSGTSTYSLSIVLTGRSGGQAKLRVVLPSHNTLEDFPDVHAQGTSPKRIIAFK